MPISFVMFVNQSDVSTKLPLDGLLWNLTLGTSIKICQDSTNLVKIGQKCQMLDMTTKYVHSVDSSIKYFVTQ